MSEINMFLECPFTWGIDEKALPEYKTTTYREDLGDPDYKEHHHPLFWLMRYVTFAYADTIRNDYNSAEKCLQDIANIWNDVDKSKLTEEGISVKVGIHIIEATKYYTLKQRGDSIEVDKVFGELQDFENFNSQIDLATLNGCKSLLWQNLYEPGKKNAIHFAKLAIEYSPNCALWHFILGTQLRFVRRREEFNIVPSDDEARAFLESYKISKSPKYGIFVAQMYREMSNYNMSDEIYLKIYDMKPRELDIQLRLAFNFIKKKDFERAKSCLDYCQQLAPQDRRFLHYKGIFFLKQKNYKIATKYFKDAKECQNFQADVQYLFCMQEYDKKFDSIEYCEAMLKKYNSIFYKLQIFIIIAQNYTVRKQHVNALECLLEAIKLDPESCMLKKYFDMRYHKYINIINAIRNDLLPEIKTLSAIPIDVQNMVAEIETFMSRYE